MKKAFTKYIIIQFIATLIVIHCYSNIFSYDSINVIVKRAVMDFNEMLFNRGPNHNKNLLLVINFVEVDSVKCEFSISYIRNFSEISRVKPLGYIFIDNQIVLIRSHIKIANLIPFININHINALNVLSIKPMLFNDTDSYSGITYNSDYWLVIYNHKGIEIKKSLSEHFLDKKYLVKDTMLLPDSIKVNQISIEEIPY